MYAVLRHGNHQYRVAPGDMIQVEKFEAEPGQELEFEDVLVLNDGSTTEVGKPRVEGATVKAKVLGGGRSKKVTVYKFKRRKGYSKKQGHRQSYVQLRVTEILKNGTALQAPAEPAAAEA